MNDWLRLVEEHDPQAMPLLDRQEMVWVAALEADGDVRAFRRVAMGGCSKVDVYLPPLLAVPIGAGVDRFTLLHNHPSGSPHISQPDKALTRIVLNAATTCGLTLVDHVILAGRTAVSLVAHNILEAAPVMAQAAE